MFGNNQNLLQLNWLSTYMLYQWFRYTWVFHLAHSSLVFHLNYGVNKRFFFTPNKYCKREKDREREKNIYYIQNVLSPKYFCNQIYCISIFGFFNWFWAVHDCTEEEKKNGETKIPRKIGLWFFPRSKWISIIFNVHIIWINTLDFYRNFSTWFSFTLNTESDLMDSVALYY